MGLINRNYSSKSVLQKFPTVISNFSKTLSGGKIENFLSNQNQPLRAELYTTAQLETLAHKLAEKHIVFIENANEGLLKRLSQNEVALLDAYQLLTESIKDNEAISPAGEWLMDNFYLIEEQIYTGKKHLPKGYSRGLPKLAKGSFVGLPRVYDLAVKIISHSDGLVDMQSLRGFIAAYQKVSDLKIGELWAIPIMLRLALIENLRRLSGNIIVDLTNKRLAQKWATELSNTAQNDSKSLILVIADMARSNPPMESAFVAEISKRFQEKGTALSLAASWIEQTLLENGLNSAELIQYENQKQAADQVSISNSIGSLRFLGTSDWREFVEEISVIEAILSTDPAGTYALMDFTTRDSYRHVVEKIAKASNKPEKEIALKAIELCHENKNSALPRASHVGYYLLDIGEKQLSSNVNRKYTFAENYKKIFSKSPLFFYAGSIVLLTAIFTALLIWLTPTAEVQRWVLYIVGFFAAISTSQLAFSIVNWFSTVFSTPTLLPRLNFSKGIPEASATMVVVPTLLSSGNAILTLVEALEVRYIANSDPNTLFALLTDFKDATGEQMPEDEQLINITIDKIHDLNNKYSNNGHAPFCLFHRPRKWNPKEKVWMGFERKRGKLADLNNLLRGHGREHFSVIIGNETLYKKTKYIVTLDSDTQMPREAVAKLAGTMAHPLNKPVFNEQLKRVTSGYTILQPRVSNSLPAQHSSLYTKLHGNEPGTDPYTLAVSDVYQDLFQEGSFIGKGIYDVDAFEIVLANRFPVNRILSHDLLEGSYARAGLCTDVQLYEDYPSAYITDMLRRHRWIRGDWQIASWTTPFVPGTEKKLIKNPLSALSRWKIFDNLRRSILPMAHIYLLAYGWLLSSNPIIWTAVIMSISFLPPLVNFIWQMFNRPSDVLFYQHLIYSFRGLKDGWIIQVIDTFCLPYTAYSNTDAIARTLWRVYFSKRKLLQWTPFNSNAYDERNIIGIFVRMWVSPFLAVAILIAIQFYFPLATIAAAPLIAAWLIAPFMVWYISRTGSLKPAQINAEESKYLRLLSRRIWLFFQNFVTANDNYLPPDNFQETPVERTAHRTSPTNIGLALLANVTAFDFGYIGIYQLLERTTQTLQSSQKLEKYKGHLYNWYDTQTLEPLHPRYVSTVDSGNLMGHLITLKQALLALPDEKIITATQFEGLLDTVDILLQKNEIVTLNNFKQKIEKSYPFHLENIFTLKAFLEDLEGNVTQIFLSQDFNNDDAESEPWTEQIFAQIKAMKHELFQFIPWLNMPNVPEKFTALVPDFALMPSVLQLSKIEQALLQNIFLCYHEENTAEENLWLDTYREAITESSRRAKELMLRVAQLAQKCTDLADADYQFLYDSTQNLLSIGYNVDENRRDNSFYDLLASEARLASFTAIAMGKLPQANWFNLGRQLTNVGSLPILLSWSGSVFEYLMPLLVMPTYENTLLDQTYKAVVEKQIEYGRKKNIPWGISESGYSLLDAHLNWQYRAFGVPGIGFKRGLGEDLVVSPYSTIMCLMVAPQAAHDNLKIMEAAGFMGKYGFYEAIDYTTSRLQRKQTYNVIKSFMAHHQGMAFLSLSYLINEQPMQKRFTADLQVKSALLILQEKVPIITNFYSPTVHAGDVNITPGGESNMRVITNPNTQIPEVQLLSNGRYNVMVTSAGGGYSKWKDIALTRWRQDATCDDWGTFCFIKDLEHDSFWSIAHQPALKNAENYEAVFSQGRAEFRRKDFSLEIHTEIVVSPEDDIELRRVHISNRSRQTRTIQITSYAEVVLAPAAADESHPAFSNLFVQTALQKDKNAILCTRRPRSAKETTPVMFHILKVRNATINNVSYETNRVAFIGRGNTIHNPSVMNLGSLQNTEGAVLDPIVAIQYSVEIEPYETVIADLLYGAADNTEAAQLLIDKYQDNNFSNRVLELAWTHSQVILRQINASEHDAQLYARMASAIIFVNPALRTNPAIIIKNNRGQSGLWSSAISGDIPIVLLQIEDSANILLVKQLLQAHNYWRLKGLTVDLIIWNEDHGGYRQELQNEIQNLVTPFQIAEPKDKQGAIFIKSADQISNEDRILFQTVARIIISDKLGTLEEQLNRANSIKTAIPYFSPAKFYPSLESKIAPNKDLIFNNGYGGFTPDGKEYIVQTSAELKTPAPWVNVIANSGFGFVVSEGGQMYTWIENAHSFRLTPWNNDPVGDLRGEAFYIRDEESGRFWSPTALPCCGKNLYRARHGFGYSVFEHSEDGIESTMTVYTHIELPIKFIAIKLKNNSSRPRKISATGYVEWVLGDLREKNMMHIVSELDVHTGALLARNAYNTALDGKVAFFDADDINRSFTTDRTEFIGRNGTMANPEAMNKARLSGRKGAALDPCAALQVTIDIVEEEEKEIIFRLGAAANIDEALKLVQQFEGSYAAKQALEEVHNYWNSTLSILQIETPDAATNLIANGWLTYQTLACRVWARSGFYQSGGAFGYRDQLQDVMALLYAQPVLARKHILLCASRQFREGDVQHWWHPPAGRGVRTTCSDDYLWLPFVTLKYLAITGDKGILNEHIHYLEGRLLNEGEESSYDLPIRSDAADSLYMHCVTAIKHSLTFGEHGLPFIGSGDWNDGMDKVGAEGKGESIWLAWLMYDILTDFAKVADEKADNGFAVLCTNQAETLKENINKNGWDGEWYRRAYFDDGTPLGSSQNEECKIDSIAQSWSVISGGGNAAYSQKAMQSAYEKLVRKDIGIIQLFDPPFDKSDVNPGYIKGYVPGVRENGGQYTHAAIWLVMAYAKLGQRERTWELLSMINPINRANSKENVARYKVEPYVIAADVYAQPLHQGRGGWTWYTGSAGWMYQLVIESFVGMKKMGDSLHFTPTMPEDWKEVKVNYRFLDTNYKIVLLQTGKKEIIQNGIIKDKIELINSGETVHVTVEW